MMSSPLRQGQALVVLLVRQWLRAGMPGVRIERFRKGSALVVRLAVVVMYLGIARILGDRSLASAGAGVASVEWLLAGLLGFDACWGMSMRARALRGMALPLGSPLLDTLPTHDAVRTAVELLEVALAHAITAVAFATAAPALPTGDALMLGGAASVAAAVFGAALMRWLFVFATPERVASLARVALLLQGFFLVLALIGPSAGWKIRPFFLSPLARPLAGEGGLADAFGFIAAVFAAAVAALTVAERIGYDRADVVPQKRLASAAPGQLSVAHIDELLSGREPGGRRRLFVLISMLSLFGLGAAIVGRGGVVPGASEDFVPTLFVGFTGWTAVVLAETVATRAVTRDLVARPLLSALPIEPRQLIDGKISVVRRRLALGLAPLLFALVSPLPGDLLRVVAWRSAAVGAGAWTYGSAAVCVAFLTGGAQGARPQPGGTVRLESLLLLGPLTALFAAQNPWMTLVPLAGLWLVGFEAKRAATRVVRWLDDGEDFERETPAWRAALAFAAFQGSQVLVARLLSGWSTNAGVVLGASYVASALFLAALVAYGRRDLGPIRIWPENPLAIAVGLATGIGTAAFACIVVRRLFVTEVGPLEPHFDSAGQLAFSLATGTVAPLVEELFFRGWLQHVIARELPGNRRWLAPVIAALAFASVHPPASFLAVFPLGLVAGVLYARTRSLAPSVVAHAAHNWGVILLS